MEGFTPHRRAETTLLERDAELAALEAALDRAAAGSGSLVVIEASAGVGKSALLHAASRGAAARGQLWLGASGAPLERPLAFGVVSQLDQGSGGRLAGRPDPDAPASPFAAIHDLFWRTAELAAERPVAIGVDDAHWADDPSLEWLAYLGRRTESLPIALVVAARPPVEAAPPAALAALRAEPAAVVLEPATLTPEGVATCAAEYLGDGVPPELAGALHEASGGNPFLLEELLRTMPADVSHTADVAWVASTAPAGVRRTVEMRLAASPAGGRELAQAVAVLGQRARLADAAALAELDPGTAAACAEALAGVALLAPGPELFFAHPVIRQTVLETMTPLTRANAHGRAAQILAARGADAEQVAGHCLNQPTGGAGEIVPILRRAAAEAQRRGAPEASRTYLRRALDETGAARDRTGVLAELGRSEAMLQDPEAGDHLLAAYTEGGDPAVALAAAQSMVLAQRTDEAMPLLERAIGRTGPGDARLRLEAELLWQRFYTGQDPALPPAPPAGTATERALLAVMASVARAKAQPARVATGMATAAWSDGRLLDEERASSTAVFSAIGTMVLGDEFDLAAEWTSAAVEEAQRRGDVLGFVVAMGLRAYNGLRRGRIAEAASDARAGLEAQAANPEGGTTPLAIIFGVEALVEAGAEVEASRLLEEAGLDGALPEGYPFHVLREHRGRIRVALGDVERGLDDLMGAGERLAWYRNPVGAWRSHAAPALRVVGREEEAVALVRQELEIARRVGAPRQEAIALRAAALLRSPVDLEALQRSAELARRAGAVLVEARALTDSGAALRRANRRAEAREPLRRALDLAATHGAVLEEARAGEELRAAGGRPRARYLTGIDALTPSERRVAGMAAAGSSNREIARDLFVTLRTVESHLTSAYRKLAVSSRADLQRALAAGRG